MKRILATILSMCLFLSCMASSSAEESQYTIENGYIEGSILINGNEIRLNALYDAEIPTQLKNILLKPSGLTYGKLQEAIDDFFTVGEKFKKGDFSPEGTFSFATPFVGQYFPIERFMEDYHEIAPTIHDTTLSSVVNNCKAFLDSLEIRYYPIPNYASYHTSELLPSSGFSVKPITQAEAAQIGKLPYTIILSLVIDDVMIPPGYTGDLGSPDGINADKVLISDPTACFVFNENGQLEGLTLSSYGIKEEQQIDDEIISWQNAFEIWYADFASDPMGEAFLEKCEIRITRIQYVWLTSFKNILRPGWYFECISPNKETGVADEFYVYMTKIGVDAITGGI